MFFNVGGGHNSCWSASHVQVDAHHDDANAVTYTDQSCQVICSGGDDGVCKVWDRRILERGVPVGVFGGHKDGITYVDTKARL